MRSFIVKYSTPSLGPEAESALWNKWIEFIEALGLLCTGGRDKQHLYRYEIWATHRETSEADREAVKKWIIKHRFTLVSCSRLRTVEQ